MLSTNARKKNKTPPRPRPRTSNRRTSPRFLNRHDDELLFHEPKKVIRVALKSHRHNHAPASPETTCAVVMCYTCEIPTVHTFMTRRTVQDAHKTVLYNELIYRCRRCRRPRVWGSEEPGS